MFAEWYKPGCLLEYPLHGSGAVVDALVRGMQKFGGRLALGSHVEEIVVENGRAVGVRLNSGPVSQIVYITLIIKYFEVIWDGSRSCLSVFGIGLVAVCTCQKSCC